jgi:DNA replication licensing factor MCM2
VSKGLPVAVRHIESILRMVEASARMRLATSVTDEDINLAISTMLESFISAQKYAVQRALRRQFASYLHAGVDMNALLLNNLRSLVREKQALGYILAGGSGGGDSEVASLLPETLEIRVAELEERAARHRLSRVQLEGFFTSAAFRNAGFEWLPSRKLVVTHNAAVNG